MTKRKKILLVDDDDMLRETLRGQFEEEFVVEEAANGAEALAVCCEPYPDIVILDIGLPDMDGREVCGALRNADVNCPVIMLTGADTETDTVRGLDAGANDYVTKPFKFSILLARIRAQLRQHERSEDAVFSIGPYRFHPAAKVLTHPEGSRIRLTEKEVAILKYLLRRVSGVTGRQTLLNEVWGYNSGVTTHTLETHVYRLRQKIERDPSKAEILITEPGGYRLVP